MVTRLKNTSATIDKITEPLITSKTIIMVLSVPLMRDSMKVSSSASQVVTEGLIAKVAVIPFPHIHRLCDSVTHLRRHLKYITIVI